MSLEVEYERPYQKNEPESLQNIILKGYFYNIRPMYPETLIRKILLKHKEKLVRYAAECEYEIVFRIEHDNKICENNFSIYLLPQVKNHRKIKELEYNGYQFYKIDILTTTVYNSIKDFHPMFYNKYIPKPMIATKILQQIDKNFDNFKHLACEYNCLDLNRLRNCKNTNPVTRYVCYKSYSKQLIKWISPSVLTCYSDCKDFVYLPCVYQ